MTRAPNIFQLREDLELTRKLLYNGLLSYSASVKIRKQICHQLGKTAFTDLEKAAIKVASAFREFGIALSEIKTI